MSNDGELMSEQALAPDRAPFASSYLKRAALMLANVAAALVLWGCQFGAQTIHFTEEVKLASGEVIIVDRLIKAEPLGEIGGPGGWESAYMSLEIVNSKRAAHPPKWESIAGLLPILFDTDPGTGEWVLLATFYTCEPWYALGRPKLPYAEFRVRNGQWQRVELLDKWIGRPANVFTGVSIRGEPKLLTLAEKHSRDSDTRIAPEYRSIVGHWTTGC